MKVRVLDEKVSLHSSAEVTSPTIIELHSGDQIDLGKTVKTSGVKWVAATLSDGKVGYVPGTIKVFRIRTVALAQNSIDVFESPEDGSKLKTTYKSGDKFILAGVVNQTWFEVHANSGDIGFVRSEFMFKEIANVNPQSANEMASKAASHTQSTSCPKCSKSEISGPFVSWKWVQASLFVYFMGLFTISNVIEQANKRANMPTAEDFVFNPFAQKAPKVYVPADYSPLYVVGVLGLCVVVFLFFCALLAKNTCRECGHSWKVGSNR